MAEKRVEKKSEKSEAKKNKKSRPSNWILLAALVLLALAVYLIYSGTQQAQTQPTASGGAVNQPPALQGVTAAPQATAAGAEGGGAQTPAATEAPAQPAAGECKLFKNKYTSEFRCLGCVVEANNPNPECFRTSRDWSEVASGTSGYYCVWDETLKLGCKTMKN
jgi:hypothetical protein